MHKSKKVIALIAPALLWWVVLCPFVILTMDWFSPIWIGGGFGLIGLCLSYSRLGIKNKFTFSISLSLISIGILSAASGFYFAIPSESELANSQPPEFVFHILAALRICMVSAVLGGLLQLYNFGGYGMRILSATNKRFQSDANFSRT